MGSYLSTPTEPNDPWCADFKGQFRLKNRVYCYPLTITDFSSRYLISCEALESTAESTAFKVFEQSFHEFGLPEAIRTDNGVPFACSNSLWNLSKLSVWWLRLGIKLERIEPGNPQQNGRHERMHCTLKQDATNPAGQNFLQQQETFFKFIEEYNFERPHQAIAMKVPGDLYSKSPRAYTGLSDLTYPGYDKILSVTNCGRVCLNSQKIHLRRAFANQTVGLQEIDHGLWEVNFMDFDLGFFDQESKKFSPRDDPFRIRIG